MPLTDQEKLNIIDGMINNFRDHLKNINKLVANGEMTFEQRKKIIEKTLKELSDLELQKIHLERKIAKAV